MSDTIPSDSHSIGDSGHVTDHNNLADVVGLMASVLAQMGTGMGQGHGWEVDPAGNADNIATINAMQSVMFAPTTYFNTIDHLETGAGITNANVGTISTTADMRPLTVGNSYIIEMCISYEPTLNSTGKTVTPILSWGGGVGAATNYSWWGDCICSFKTGGTSSPTAWSNQQTSNLPFSVVSTLLSGQMIIARYYGVVSVVTTADVPVIRFTSNATAAETLTVHAGYIRVTPTWEE